MKSLSDILKNNKLSTPLLKGVRAAKVMEESQKLLIDIFGPEMSRYAAPAFYKNETLTIAFLSTAAAQEFKFRETLFLESLNRNLGGIPVTKVVYMT